MPALCSTNWGATEAYERPQASVQGQPGFSYRPASKASIASIDASLALALAVPLPYSDRVVQLAEDWKEQKIRFAVPAAWGYEVVSGLRKAVTAEFMAEEADVAIRNL